MPKYYCRLPVKELDQSIEDRYILRSNFDMDDLNTRYKGNVLLEDHLNISSFKSLLSKKSFNKDIGGGIYLEVACGVGHFLIDVAKNERDKLFIGLDYAYPVIQRAILRAHENQLDNILFFCGRVEDYCIQFEKEEVFDSIMINYPDPWPKKKHIKRRIIQKNNIENLLPFLKHKGNLMGVTDIEELMDYHMEELSIVKGIQNTLEDRNKKPSPWYEQTSSFERRAEKEGRKKYYFMFKKKLT